MADASNVAVRGSLSRAEIETILTGDPIPLRLACRTPSDDPWIVTLWFRYHEADETIQCATGAGADVVTFLDHDDGVAFDVSTNEQPYAGVRGRGRARVTPDPEKATLRALLERYQGSTDTPLARRLLDDAREEVTIEIDPAVVYGWDFST